ncbi:ABC transporter permease [Brevundimonas subvibrioides]|uniref:Lantibiotic export permease protein n=1 Tax=Brevundimonas subvibrioides (strain ATCC 15264 / DSM 4735 / LMG 14903 / NBRC 16000 / CB 81) TaxID=633149 RepID=D9QGC3_BRESC|nr:ABC transporter permease [Brevundimonas subvibrioides]ADL00739.1 lantibiotic export permease protein [Brevundimonas subvibrioides ATCC 15264]
MLAFLAVELRKLNRSLALLLALAAPTLIAIFVFFNMLRSEEAQHWEMYTQGATGIWAFFMLPMSVTALTALVAHMEHGPRAWDHLRALPVARWKLYAAKAICVLGVVAAMSLLNLLLTWGAVSLAAAIKPVLTPTGVLDLGAQAILLAKVLLAAILMIAIQFWIAIRFSSFVPALAVGIGGTFFSVVATAAKQGVFFPWQMPVNMLATEAWRVNTALALGGGVGVIVLVAAVVHLTRREVL